MANFLPMAATLMQHMGNDKVVVDAARVSFAKYSALGFGQGDPTMSDASLIEFLATGMQSAAREMLAKELMKCDSFESAEEIIARIRDIATHWTAFGHCTATFHVRAPIFVHRQITRSGVGLVINEESRRYVSNDPNFYLPTVWRSAVKDKKQGSGGALEPWANVGLKAYLVAHSEECLSAYRHACDLGAAPEQARMFLPLNTHTEWVWTGSLYAWARICNLRLAGDAQAETGEVAKQISAAMLPLFPFSWRALVRAARTTL